MRSVIIICLLFASCHAKKAEKIRDPIYPVRVISANEAATPIFIEALGHVESVDRIDIRSRIQGELTGVYFKQGQEVKKGDLLFTIDSRPYAAELETAKGALEQSLAQLSLAEDKVKRFKTLAQMEFYSQIDYQTLQTNLASSQGLVQQNQGQVDRAAVNLDYCWIYSPIDALTGIQQIDLGNLVSVDGATPLVTLNQIAPIYVTLSIPEAKLYQVQRRYNNKEKIPVLAAYENFESEVFEGTLFMLDNAVDDKTGMIKLRALFPNKQRELWPGQFVRTRVILSIMEKAILIPYSAVQLTEKGPIAFVVESNHTVQQRALKLGQRQDDHVVALEGICVGETLVVEGQLNLTQGSKVEIIP